MDPSIIDPNRKWRGYDQLKYLFVFGDSYSAVGFPPTCPEPDKANPIGVPWPGSTWSEDKPIWVGHLIDRYTKQDLLVYDYAIGGYTVTGVAAQIQDYFLKSDGPGSDERKRWKAEDSLSIIWVGVNDIAGEIDVEKSLKRLFQSQDELYKSGARNFLVFNVPPLPNRWSTFKHSVVPSRVLREKNCAEWNARLPALISSFTHDEHPDTSTFLFDAHAVFERVLADPTSHGFGDADGEAGAAADGEVWVDFIHPTSAMHRIIAEEVARFLTGREDVEREPRFPE